MKNTKVKMIATDLDGTLLRYDGSVSMRTRETLAAALDAGIEIVPATGRPLQLAAPVMKSLDFVPYWVLANGALTWHSGESEVVRASWLEPHDATQLIHQIRDLIPQAGFAFVGHQDRVAFEAGFERVVPNTMGTDPCGDILDEFDGPVLKVLVFDKNDPGYTVRRSESVVEDLHRRVQQAVGTQASARHSGLRFIELAAGDVTKATALASLADDLGIDASEVVAFGDYHNDVDMLQWAGLSYAPAHASPDAIGAADHVIGSNDDDSVAGVIEQLL